MPWVRAVCASLCERGLVRVALIEAGRQAVAGQALDML
jgi:hypothetical protein